MAVTETKIIQVDNEPEVINQSNELWGSFGWNVLNVQVTHSQDTKTYTKGLDYYTGDKTVETTTINYATITYQRDKGIPNYRQIAALEKEYAEIDEQLDALYFVDSKANKGLFLGLSPKDLVITVLLIIFFFPAGIIFGLSKYLKYRSVSKTREGKMS